MLDFALEGVVMGNQQELIESRSFLGLKDGICKFVAAVGVNAISGLIENTEPETAEFLNHRQRHGECELGLLAT